MSRPIDPVEEEFMSLYRSRCPGTVAKLAAVCIDEHLTNTQKCYIMLHYRHGLSITQIAGAYNVNKSTVSRTIRRGMARLRRAMHAKMLENLFSAADDPHNV